MTKLTVGCVSAVEEPATEERPLIQTPATFEGDEIAEPMETDPSPYVPSTVPQSSTVPETLTETIKTNTVYSAPTQPSYPPTQVLSEEDLQVQEILWEANATSWDWGF